MHDWRRPHNEMPFIRCEEKQLRKAFFNKSHASKYIITDEASSTLNVYFKKRDGWTQQQQHICLKCQKVLSFAADDNETSSNSRINKINYHQQTS